MSVVDTSSVDCVHQRLSKRKLDDYDHDFDDELVSVRMRKDEISTFHYSSSDAVSNRFESSINSPVLHSSLSLPPCFLSSSSSSASFGQLSCFVARLQFFVRMISEGNTLVIQGNPGDTVKSIHERIQAITGIPVIEQRLIYRGKQLHWEQSLADCGIQNDAGLQLVGRMRSTGHPLAWQVIDDMISVICRLCKNESTVSCAKSVKPQLNEFLKMISRNDSEAASGFLQIFSSSSAPAALVMLYMSPLPGNKDAADDSIRFFLNTSRYTLPKSTHTKFVPVVLEFCKLLHRNAREDSLYFTCRNILGSFIESIGSTPGTDRTKPLVWLQQIFPFVNELASGLSKDLVEAVESPVVAGPLHADVQDFSAFVLPLRTTAMEQVAFCGPIAMPLRKGADNYIFCVEEANFLYIIYIDLVQKMDACLFKIEGFCKPKGTGENDVSGLGWYRHLALLRELSSISKLYAGCEQHFWTMLRNRKVSFCALILNCTKQNEDNQWLHEYNDVIDFESRRHLVMMMFPKVKDEYEELHEMLIDRSQILAESFEYIAHADPQSLHGGLFMEFKNEQATGPGVLREWFFLVCQAIFNQKNALFVACPNDRRRFYPNPASKVDPLHLQYFTFAGRVIALALMHKVQVGIVFDRVFFLQLGGRHVTLEDICDADPCLYNSCKQILVMDAEFLDSDGLGLTFVREVEEMGSRKVVELCRGGKSVIVNSKNREEYVHLLIQHQFVTSIEEQVSHFAQGFADILSNSISQSSFFHCLHIGDLDWMLHGSELGICIEEWKAHTEYNGYKETDPQISWLWKIVGEMSVEQRKTLLFFWTSVKYLPIEGFKGLGSLLYIYKTAEPEDRLPSSHTCFNRLCLPSYSCVSTMQSRLNIITQKHLGCSFGNW